MIVDTGPPNPFPYLISRLVNSKYEYFIDNEWCYMDEPTQTFKNAAGEIKEYIRGASFSWDRPRIDPEKRIRDLELELDTQKNATHAAIKARDEASGYRWITAQRDTLLTRNETLANLVADLKERCITAEARIAEEFDELKELREAKIHWDVAVFNYNKRIDEGNRLLNEARDKARFYFGVARRHHAMKWGIGAAEEAYRVEEKDTPWIK